jgi:hypothetical protein
VRLGRHGRRRCAGGDGIRRQAAVNSPGNHVNVISATISTRVWSGRKRSRRGTRLRDQDEAPGAEEG